MGACERFTYVWVRVSEYRSLLSECGSLLSEDRSLLSECRSILSEYVCMSARERFTNNPQR